MRNSWWFTLMVVIPEGKDMAMTAGWTRLSGNQDYVHCRAVLRIASQIEYSQHGTIVQGGLHFFEGHDQSLQFTKALDHRFVQMGVV